MAKTFGLGRGLDALIPRAVASTEVPEIPIERIARNPHQPRNRFDETETEIEDGYELAIRVWPGDETLAALVDFHGNWIDWLAA